MRPARLVMTAGLFATLVAATPSAAAGTVNIFAAASTQAAIDRIIGDCNRSKPKACRAVYAASSTLAKQIANGAPAAIYVSASSAWMDWAEQGGLLTAGTRSEVATNALVLVTPSDRGLTLPNGISDLPVQLSGARLAVGDPAHVPAGIYAEAALRKLGLWPALSKRLARMPDVRAALNLVERGETPAGIVYRSDAAGRPKVRIIHVFSDIDHPRIIYSAAIVKTGDGEAARRVMALIVSEAGRTAFAAAGFAPAARP